MCAEPRHQLRFDIVPWDIPQANLLSDLRVLIAGGGTGGHIIPALAVARELVARHAAEILFVGTPRGMESRLVPDAGFRLRLIDVGPLKNVSLLTRLRTTSICRAVSSRAGISSANSSPAVVFGVGGYASGPGMAAALQMKIPTLAFEPNAMPGFANRLVGKRVQAAAVNFPAAAKWFRNAEVTGIPVRPEFFSIAAAASRASAVAGLRRLAGRAALQPDFAQNRSRAARCGSRTHHPASERRAPRRVHHRSLCRQRRRPSRWQVEPFLNDMPARFAQAHLVMARSGASTVAELAAAGKPALLIPFAAAADDHQTRNAEAMVNAGAAAMLD